MINAQPINIDLTIKKYSEDIFEKINEVKEYINSNDCERLYIDISNLNMVDATKICVLCSTFHFSKYPDGKITWYVKDEITRSLIKRLKLTNTDVFLFSRKSKYIDFEQTAKIFLKYHY